MYVIFSSPATKASTKNIDKGSRQKHFLGSKYTQMRLSSYFR